MESKLTVRKAVPEDAPGVATVQVLSWQSAYQGILPQTVLDKQSIETRTERWATILGENASHTLVALCDDRVVGFCSAAPSRDDDTDPQQVGEIWALYALPETWGQGVGRALWLAAVAYLQELGFESLVLWVLADNHRGRRFYERAGCNLDPDEERTKTLHADGQDLPQVRYWMDL